MIKKLAAYGIKFPFLGQTAESFLHLSARERFVLIAGWMCDIAKVREKGWNRGPMVTRILRSIGLGPGYPWCAAFVSLCAELAEFNIGPKFGRGAVRNWRKWAKEDNRLGFKAMRGDLCFMLNPDGTGHIEIVTSSGPGEQFVDTIGGNTNEEGSREGDGVYRKIRNKAKWHFIRT